MTGVQTCALPICVDLFIFKMKMQDVNDMILRCRGPIAVVVGGGVSLSLILSVHFRLFCLVDSADSLESMLELVLGAVSGRHEEWGRVHFTAVELLSEHMVEVTMHTLVSTHMQHNIADG